jgi:cellulose synthase/poly-beta-1,6-N-acetylglucosamine synthase-like glycosyltransferase
MGAQRRPAAAHTRERIITLTSVVALIVLLGVYSAQVIQALRVHHAWGDLGAVAEIVVFLGIMYVFALGGLAYMLTRLGMLRREQDHRAASTEEVREQLFGPKPAPSVLVLVPSYREEPEVVWRTLLSAAVQEYPNQRIALLVDDPPPTTAEDKRALDAVLALPGQIRELLAPPAARLTGALRAFEATTRPNLDAERERLAQLNEEVADYFARWADQSARTDHMTTFFAEELLGKRATQARAHAAHLRAAPLDLAAVHREYRRLACLFQAEIVSFQRKQYHNLSHAPNKAMNLNSYLALLGGSFDIELQGGRRHLVRSQGTPDLVVPDTDLVIILDADSVVVGHYAQTLAHILGQPGMEDVAVAQAPYRSFPNHATLLERSAAATTDVMYVGHIGFTHYNAGFMIGASTMIRMHALRQVRTETIENGLAVPRFIHDRTMIEDAETSVDLICKGWRLVNHPARMSWSATPRDFGSLLIQRRRWADGGLILFPKLLRYVLRRVWHPREFVGAAVSAQYLAVGAFVNLGMLMMLVYPFEALPWSVWGPLAAAPYFYLYGRDLVQQGYQWADLARAYALNVLLIPIIVAGTVKSVQQLLSKERAPFARTPKVADRTGAPARYIAFELVLVTFLFAMVGLDLATGRWVHAAFSGGNGLLLLYGVTVMMDPHAALQDLARPISGLGATATSLGRSPGIPAPLPVRAGSERRRRG